MGLPTTIFDLQFAKGIQTKVDSKTQLQGELKELENVIFDKIGRVDKRGGFNSITRNAISGSIATAKMLTTFKDQLLLFTGTDAYTYSESLSKWKFIDQCMFNDVENHEINQDNYQQLLPSVAYSNGLELHVYESNEVLGGASYTPKYKIIDSTTRAVIVENALYAADSKPKAFAIGNYFVIICSQNSLSKLVYYTIPIATPADTYSGPNNLVTTYGATYYDASQTSSYIFVSYYNTSNHLKYVTLSSALAISSEYTVEAVNRTRQLLSTWCDDSNRFWIADGYDNGASKHVLRASCWNYAGSSTLALTNAYVTASSPGIYRCGGVTVGNTASIFIENNATSSHNISLSRQTVTTGGTLGYDPTALAVWQRSLGLAAKPFLKSDNSIIIPAAHESTYQSTYFLLTVNDHYNPVVIAKILPGLCGGVESSRFINHVVTKSTDIFLFANTVKSSVRSETDVFFSLLGVNVSVIDMTGSKPIRTAELGDNLVIAGGLVSCFDGSDIYENNFHLYPENISATSANGAGVLTNSGTYFYKVIYSHLDNNGNPHYSTPSDGYEVNLGASDDTVTLTIPTLRITARENVKIDIYRTTNAGTVYYKLTGIGDEVYNSTSSDTVTYVDLYADSEITGNEPLYTEGEVYNSSPVSCSVAVNYKDRVWLAGLEDRLNIWYSKKNVLGKPVNFNDTFAIRFSPHGGQIKDVAQFIDYLMVIKERAIYAVSGEGVNNAGTGTDFNTPQLVSSDIGIKYPGVTASTPNGLMFVSHKGIHLLSNNSMGLEAIGSNVDAYDGYTFTAAAQIPNRNKVVFFTNTSAALVYDYFAQQWAVWTSSIFSNVISACVYDNELAFATSDGYVYQSCSDYDDASNSISMVVGTGWYSPTGQQGYSMLHKLSIIGDYYSSHDLRVEVMFDYDDTKKRTFTINAGSIVTASGDSNRYQFDLRLNKKCMAFRVRITSLNDDSGRALSLSGLRAEVAILPGNNRLPETNKKA